MSICCNFCGKSDKILKKTNTRLAAGVNEETFICEECVSNLNSMFGVKEIETSFEFNPTPRQIKEYLDEYVIAQDKAKKTLSVAIYNHYKRIHNLDKEISKSNILMIGPSGCGKTELARHIAKFLNVPFAIADATSLTEAGYVGDDVENVLLKLIQAADGDIAAAEQGIIFIDEIDKIGRKSESTSITRDVSGEGVQQALLKLIEGTDVRVPATGGRKHPNGQCLNINTENILFICSGAFEGINDIVEKRCKKNSKLGFGQTLEDNTVEKEKIITKDIISFGLIPELVGRLPILTTIEQLSKEDLVRILIEPKNSIVKQFQKLLAMDNIELIIDNSALEKIAEKCFENKTGARGLRSVLEDIMEDIMFEVPDKPDVSKVIITDETIETHIAEYVLTESA